MALEPVPGKPVGSIEKETVSGSVKVKFAEAVEVLNLVNVATELLVMTVSVVFNVLVANLTIATG